MKPITHTEINRFSLNGETGTGKTTRLIENLHAQKLAIPNTWNVLISSTFKDSNLAWEAYYKRQDAIKNLIDVWIDNIDNECLNYVEKLIDERRTHFNKYLIVNLAMDDCGANPVVKNRKIGNNFEVLANTAGHRGINFMYLTQYVTQMMTSLKKGWQIAYVMWATDLNERENIRKLYLGFLPQETAQNVMATAWQEKYDHLIIDKRNPPDIEVFRGRADGGMEKIPIKSIHKV